MNLVTATDLIDAISGREESWWDFLFSEKPFIGPRWQTNIPFLEQLITVGNIDAATYAFSMAIAHPDNNTHGRDILMRRMMQRNQLFNTLVDLKIIDVKRDKPLRYVSTASQALRIGMDLLAADPSFPDYFTHVGYNQHFVNVVRGMTSSWLTKFYSVFGIAFMVSIYSTKKFKFVFLFKRITNNVFFG